MRDTHIKYQVVIFDKNLTCLKDYHLGSGLYENDICSFSAFVMQEADIRGTIMKLANTLVMTQTPIITRCQPVQLPLPAQRARLLTRLLTRYDG